MCVWVRTWCQMLWHASSSPKVAQHSSTKFILVLCKDDVQGKSNSQLSVIELCGWFAAWLTLLRPRRTAVAAANSSWSTWEHANQMSWEALWPPKRLLRIAWRVTLYDLMHMGSNTSPVHVQKRWCWTREILSCKFHAGRNNYYSTWCAGARQTQIQIHSIYKYSTVNQ